MRRALLVSLLACATIQAQEPVAIALAPNSECGDNATIIERAPAVTHPQTGVSATGETTLQAEKRGVCRAAWIVHLTAPGKPARRIALRSSQIEEGWGISLEILGFTESGDRLLINTIKYAGDYSEYQLEILEIASRRVRHFDVARFITEAEFRDCLASFHPFGITPDGLLLVAPRPVVETTPGEQPCIEGTWIFDPRTKKRQQVDRPARLPLVGAAAR